MSEGFFSRWSRRKQEVADGQRAELQAPTATVEATTAPLPNSAPAAPAAPAVAQRQEPATPAPATAPTLADVQDLTPASDFQPFMQRGVGPEVRNAAMKKLFADPHFNVMDGLDIYIDDYSQPDPLPSGMLRRMASAQFLKLVPEEETAPAADQVVAQSPLCAPTATAPQHDDPDLQLQPDPAPADPEPGPRPG